MKGGADAERGVDSLPSDVDRGLMEEVTSRHGHAPAHGRPAPPAQASASEGFRSVPGAALNARGLLSRIQASLPARSAHLARGFSAPSRDRLVVSAIPGAPLWYQYLQVASSMDEWRVTTAIIEVLPRGVRRLRIHLPAGLEPLDPSGAPMPATIPTVDREHVGKTIPSVRRSRRGLAIPGTHGVIAVGTHVARVAGYSGRLPTRTDRDIVETFLHEAAAHAGRFSRNEPATHGDPTVDRVAADIAALFPNVATLPTAPRARVP